MPQPPNVIQQIAGLVGRFENNAALERSFGDQKKMKRAITDLIDRQQEFENTGGIYFNADGLSAFETAKKFTQMHINAYRDGARPGLPVLAEHHAEKIGLDARHPLRQAVAMVAMRAEMDIGVNPDYHDKNHYIDVAAMAAAFLYKNRELKEAGIPLNAAEQTLVLLAAIGHDVDHEGRGNAPDNPLENEEKSFMVIDPLLEAAGTSAADRARVHVMLLTTSPNGPHKILKDVMHQVENKGAADWTSIENHEKFPDLEVLAKDRTLLEMCAILSDADLYASFGAGLDANMRMSRQLTDEVQKSGQNLDFQTDGARKFAMDNIVGGSFTSAAGRALANPLLNDMMHVTQYRVVEHAHKPKR